MLQKDSLMLIRLKKEYQTLKRNSSLELYFEGFNSRMNMPQLIGQIDRYYSEPISDLKQTETFTISMFQVTKIHLNNFLVILSVSNNSHTFVSSLENAQNRVFFSIIHISVISIGLSVI